MPILPKARSNELPGDLARRKAWVALLIFLTSLPVALWLFARLEPLWNLILPLEGATFMVAATIFGTLLASMPVVAAVAFLMTVWFGVNSVLSPHSRSPAISDRIILGIGILVWFAPALAMAGAALRAVMTGSIAFSRPARVYELATDPIAFWQGVGFFLIVAGALAYPAWHYWRDKLAAPGSAKSDSASS